MLLEGAYRQLNDLAGIRYEELFVHDIRLMDGQNWR